MKNRRPGRGDVSRERILDAAAELFSQRGYAGAGVDQLASRSAIAKTAIYYHFGSKEGLLAAVLERASTTWIDGIDAAAKQGGDPIERLDRALAGMRAMLEERPWILKLLQILALEVAEEKPEVRATLQSILRRARGAIVAGLSDALGVELPNAERVAGVMLALLDGVSLGQHVDPELVRLDDAFEEMRHIIVFMVASQLNPDLLGWLEQGVPAKPLAG